jgi:hypothetical protein
MAPVGACSSLDIRVREWQGDGVLLPAVVELWQRIYADELGWLDCSVGNTLDEFHPHSHYILIELVRNDHYPVPIGTARFVMDSPLGLPIERFLPFGPFKEDRTLIEVQKMMIRPEYRSRRFSSAPFGLMPLIMQRTMRFAIAHNVSMIIADVFNDRQVSPIGPLEQIGFERIGVPFVDTELGFPVESIAMGISRGVFLRGLFADGGTTMLKYLRGEPASVFANDRQTHPSLID